jgi:hypothetical protein
MIKKGQMTHPVGGALSTAEPFYSLAVSLRPPEGPAALIRK